jgi:hypothetical protein
LRYQQPQNYQRRVDTVVAFPSSIGLCLLKKGGWEQFLESGRKPAKGGVRNEWRERECGSCLKP